MRTVEIVPQARPGQTSFFLAGWGSFLNTRKQAMAHDHAWRQNAPQDSRTRHARLAGWARRGGNPIGLRRAFLARLALHALRSVAWAELFSILIERGTTLLIGTKLLDRFTYFVHILNGSIVYPYNSWIYKVNETFSSSANSIEMAGPLSESLPPNSAWRLV